MSFTLRQLNFRYPNRTTPALVDVTIDNLPREGTVAVLGPSGSGKSTLLHLLGLLWEKALLPGQLVYHSPDRGPVDYGQVSRPEGNALRLQEFGYVLQSCYMLPHFSCRDNLTLPLVLQGYSPDEIKERVRTLLKALENPKDPENLGSVLSSLGSEVSVGQRQRVAIFRAVIHDPHVIFADEPVSNLDPQNTIRMIQLLKTWQQGALPLNGAGNGAARPPRLLFLVCHHLKTALQRARADWFIVLNSEHRLVCSMPHQEGMELPEEVLRILDEDAVLT